MSTLHVFFHSPCLDGIVSAVLAWDFLERQEGIGRVRLHPVGYDVRRSWRSKKLPRNSVIVDFSVPSRRALLADHHSTTFIRDEDRGELEHRDPATYVFAPEASSCAVALRDHLEHAYAYRNQRFDALITWADRIDSARYRNVREALLAPAAALQISLSLADADADYCRFLVKRLKHQSMSAVAKSPRVQRRVRHIKTRIQSKDAPSYAEQFQGMYALMRGLAGACLIGAANHLGWAGGWFLPRGSAFFVVAIGIIAETVLLVVVILLCTTDEYTERTLTTRCQQVIFGAVAFLALVAGAAVESPRAPPAA